MAGAAAAHLQWQRDADRAETQFFADGMHCANCANSIRRAVGALEGVRRVDVNLATTRVSVEWQPSRIGLARVLSEVERLGFRPVPLAGEDNAQARRAESRRALKRIGLAGLASMQMSMYTVGLYAGAYSGIDAWLAKLLRVTSMLLAIPVMFYSGAPFLIGAVRDLRRRSLGMDVPVAAALLLAFGASVWNTLRNEGQVYFDSVAMFVFFLLIGRYVELRVRRGSLDASEALARSLPATAMRIAPDGASRRIALAEVRAGDRLLVARGAVIPVDAVLESDTALIDEALLSGESVPVPREAGGKLAGGSLNVSAPITVRAAATARGSMLAAMMALIERSQAQRPRVARAADRAAAHFIVAILLLAVSTAVFWWWRNPARAFEATLAVLVVTCPCALSLATPAAVAAATTRLARRGVLIARPDAIESLAAVDRVMFDKTGTLTEPESAIAEIELQGGAAPDTLPRERVLALAAALEEGSNHPLAAAFMAAAPGPRPAVVDRQEHPGQGLEGRVDGMLWRLGRRDFVAAIGPRVTATPAGAPAEGGEDGLWLGHVDGLVARFGIRERLRPTAAAAVAALRRQGLAPVIASGDRDAAVARVADELGIEAAAGRLDPAGKLDYLRALQRQGHRVLMIGDGINDGPVLAAADVSCAMGRGAAIAQSAADMLLMGESLESVADAVATARGCRALVRANLHWALAYNICAVPLAAAGFVPPWLAAVGMSASSLFVVWRARRFARGAERGGT